MPHDTTSKEPGIPAGTILSLPAWAGTAWAFGLGLADKFEAEGPMAVQEITYPSGAGRAAAVAVGAGG